MNSQKEIFKASEADEWFHRNATSDCSGLNNENMVLKVLKEIKLYPKKVLEIGCSNGSRLDQLRRAFDCHCFGIDPSVKAIQDGIKRFPDLSLTEGTADDLHFGDDYFDTIIFGFCLYLCDRKDLFKIAYEADRCLQNGGTLVITDFYPPFPYKNRYSHKKGIHSYKMNYGQMFSWNPSYYEAASITYSHSGYAQRDIPDERIGVIILRKDDQVAYPEEPYSNFRL